METRENQPCCYMRNPDVVVKEEDPDGALLFDPETDRIRVLNSTGTFIWQLCDGDNDLESIAAALRESFEDAPGDQVSQQMEEFINEMIESGFVGIVEEKAGDL